MIQIAKAHGSDLERISELYGVTRVSLWEPDRSVSRRARECWTHWGTHGTVLRPDQPESVWWAPIEWLWWRIWR